LSTPANNSYWYWTSEYFDESYSSFDYEEYSRDTTFGDISYSRQYYTPVSREQLEQQIYLHTLTAETIYKRYYYGVDDVRGYVDSRNVFENSQTIQYDLWYQIKNSD
jgi:hypothetical protein